MKGLIIKDFQLLFSNKRILYIVFAIALFSAMMGDGITLTYISSFVAVMLQVSALATISYDNYQHGNTFLMTLPLRRKDYVIEKYIFCSIIAFVGIIFSLILGLLVKMRTNNMKIEIAVGIVIALVFLIYSFIAIPLELKFGNEVGRTIPFIIGAVIFLIAQILIQVNDSLFDSIMNWLNKLENISDITALMIAIAAFVIALTITIPISIKIINKKEF
ncbi:MULTISPECIES: ABC-2 transporter permease [Eubacterium]|jgi:ABC-2 type transport system permease protein|uniref:ABC-2 transporter permease n=1 Tax=Eubacterium TaxID=1730 RepID=UPI000E4A5D2A|nr:MULTISPECIES: ABC-2 transporter permease [unclassified Eubacterium (in: firmicutes)]MEE0293562.1 ABC-2 transporter permease [Eubacterium sp.]RGG66147.1 ABC-2 transporter permease [Eubacterium sp. AF17-7]RHR34576.1 ABC-2 transporter permease [Eubacterium sp. AF19-12LB]